MTWGALHTVLRRALARPGVPPDVVDDLVQDALERLLTHHPDDAERMPGYVSRVVRSVWVDHLRRRKPWAELPEELPAELSEVDLAPVVASWLPEMVEALPETYREAVRLSELEGHTQREVAERLGLSASGARTRVQRGRRLLREQLEACCRLERAGPRVTEIQPSTPCCEPTE